MIYRNVKCKQDSSPSKDSRNECPDSTRPGLHARTLCHMVLDLYGYDHCYLPGFFIIDCLAPFPLTVYGVWETHIPFESWSLSYILLGRASEAKRESRSPRQ